MSDLTPETRAEWRRDAERMPSYPRGAAGRILALLDALDEAEANRDYWVGLWKKAANSVLSLQAERDEAREVLARVEALAEKWGYKGEFGWGAWQEGHGPDQEGYVLDAAAADLRAALAGPSDTEGQA